MYFSHSGNDDDQNNMTRLEAMNSDLSVLVEKYQHKIVRLNVSTA
jgi:hypothetical protein